MTKFLFNSLIFSFLFVASNLFGDSVTTVKSPDRFTVFSKIITTDKYSTFRVILSGPFNGGYGYDSAAYIYINGQSSNYYYGNGNPGLRESGGIDKTFVIPPGSINAAFGIADENAGSTYTYDLILINSCPSTAECSSITCPYCNSQYCRVHSQHFVHTYHSQYCTHNMHTFCSDNESAYNSYVAATNYAIQTCNLCNSTYCKICGHTCGDNKCPSRPDCSTTSCSTCKSTYCSTHGLHICTAVGNASNGSSGPWNVWTQQNGQNITINVQADFQELVHAQQNANVLLQNISNTLNGFVETTDEIISDYLFYYKEDLDYMSKSLDSLTDNIEVHNIFIRDKFEKLLEKQGSINSTTKQILNSIITLLSGEIKTDLSSITPSLDKIENNTSKLSKLDDLSKLGDIASSTNSALNKLDSISSNSEKIVNAANSINDNISALNSQFQKPLNVDFSPLDPHLNTIKSNTTQIKDTGISIDETTKSINTAIHDIKPKVDQLADNVSSIKSSNDTIVSHLESVKKIITPPGSGASTPTQNLTLPTIKKAETYKTNVGPVDNSFSIPNTEAASKTEKIQKAINQFPSFKPPASDALILNFPLKTDFFDFSFSLDLTGGEHSETVTAARNTSHAVFSVFWILSFMFLFIKTLRQW